MTCRAFCLECFRIVTAKWVWWSAVLWRCTECDCMIVIPTLGLGGGGDDDEG